MTPIFLRYGVQVVAISRDTTEEVLKHKTRDKLTFPLLSDAKLKAIKAFGLLHHKALAWTSFDVLGIPLGYPAGREEMAIPTSILIDEEGAVRWIDQAEDYRIRGDESRLKEALAAAFPLGKA